MLQPLRSAQPKFKLLFPRENLSRGSKTEWDLHEAARLKRAAAARALSFNKYPVDFEYLVYKILKFLKADEKLATGFTAESIYCHARSLMLLSGDYQLFKETLDLHDRTLEKWDNESQMVRKGDDGFIEPPAKKTKPVSVREKHHHMVNFVEKCLRRYILEDRSISILDEQAQLPSTYILSNVIKKSTIRFLFYDIGVPSNVFEQFFEELPAKSS